MIGPPDIVIDTTGLHPSAQAMIVSIDTALAPSPWSPQECREGRIVTVNLASYAGPNPAKQAAVERIRDMYRWVRNWNVDFDLERTTATVRVLRFRLPD